ncbi:hypothetical protein MG293_014413 [Ovis ammon polii]|uniref:Uncharacterized protein n=1 Tax=Ovis ammon polii TaxID=230172 RepID=A0AAD4TVT1_OVIAM|nr:hypothetical protein MG293_014413 [Ovis ammon polii]
MTLLICSLPKGTRLVPYQQRLTKHHPSPPGVPTSHTSRETDGKQFKAPVHQRTAGSVKRFERDKQDFPLDMGTLEISPGTTYGASEDCGCWECGPSLRRERTSRFWIVRSTLTGPVAG